MSAPLIVTELAEALNNAEDAIPQMDDTELEEVKEWLEEARSAVIRERAKRYRSVPGTAGEAQGQIVAAHQEHLAVVASDAPGGTGGAEDA